MISGMADKIDARLSQKALEARDSTLTAAFQRAVFSSDQDNRLTARSFLCPALFFFFFFSFLDSERCSSGASTSSMPWFVTRRCFSCFR